MCVIICYMQASLNFYWLNNINLFREKLVAKGGHITRFGVYATEKSNSYANHAYPNNQHVHSNTINAILEI